MEHSERFGRILEKRGEKRGWKNYLNNYWLRISKIKEEPQPIESTNLQFLPKINF